MDAYRRKKVVFAYLVYKHFIQKKNRKYWVHPLISSRLLKGAFSSLFIDLRNDGQKFFNYFRMSISSFDELAAKLSDSIRGQDTVMRLAIPPVEMLAVTLRYLGSGCDLTELHYSYKIGRSTICKITRKVCKALWEILREECFPTMTPEKWLEVAQHFEKRANFPNCLGAIDGKHIRIVKPIHNDKQFCSIFLMAIADSNYKFVFVDIGSFGNVLDSNIYQNSNFYQKLQNDQLAIPERKPLPGTVAPKAPHVFVGDEAFGLSQHLLRPFSGSILTYKKRIFNYRLNRARRFIDSTFGILSNKWQIFHRPLKVKADFAMDIVKACCILHNYVRDRDGYQLEDTLSIEGLENAENIDATVLGGNAANQIRNRWAEYFISDAGKVPWQNDFI